MKKFLSKHKYLLFVLSIPYVLILVLAIVHIDYDVTTPATIDSIENVIEVENETNLTGSINVVSVFSYERVSLLGYLVGSTNPYAEVSKSVQYTDIDYNSLYLGGTYQKKVSLYNSVIAGYKQAGYNLNYDFYGYIVHNKTTYVDKDLNVGDMITHINGETLSNEVDISTLINKYAGNLPTLTFTIIKNFGTSSETTADYEITAKEFEKEGKKYFSFGFSVYPYNVPRITEGTPSFTIKFNNVNSLGPSGGLLQSFYVYEKLTGAKLSKNLKIAGTGTVDINGNAGPIGGIGQKIFTSELSGVDIFFIPVSSPNYMNDDTETNYIEAKKAYDSLKNPHMKIVPVWSLEEIVRYLKEYQGVE